MANGWSNLTWQRNWLDVGQLTFRSCCRSTVPFLFPPKWNRFQLTIRWRRVGLWLAWCRTLFYLVVSQFVVTTMAYSWNLECFIPILWVSYPNPKSASRLLVDGHLFFSYRRKNFHWNDKTCRASQTPLLWQRQFHQVVQQRWRQGLEGVGSMVTTGVGVCLLSNQGQDSS